MKAQYDIHNFGAPQLFFFLTKAKTLLLKKSWQKNMKTLYNIITLGLIQCIFWYSPDKLFISWENFQWSVEVNAFSFY